MTSQPCATIFDLDGVLLDSEPLYTQATQSVLDRFGILYEWSHKRHVMGRSPQAGAEWLVNELKLPLNAEQYLRERQDSLRQLFLNCPAKGGAEAFVRTLHSHGLRLAVATSSEREVYDLKIRNHPWFSLFHTVICGDDPRISQAKPAPDIFLLAASELGVKSDHCVVLEDSPAGVQAAKAAKMRVIALLSAPLVRSELLDADTIVSSYDEIDVKQLLCVLDKDEKSVTVTRKIH